MDGPTAGSVSPRRHSSDLNEVALSGGIRQFHFGFVGFQYGRPAMPVLTICNLENVSRDKQRLKLYGLSVGYGWI